MLIPVVVLTPEGLAMRCSVVVVLAALLANVDARNKLVRRRRKAVLTRIDLSQRSESEGADAEPVSTPASLQLPASSRTSRTSRGGLALGSRRELAERGGARSSLAEGTASLSAAPAATITTARERADEVHAKGVRQTGPRL